MLALALWIGACITIPVALVPILQLSPVHLAWIGASWCALLAAAALLVVQARRPPGTPLDVPRRITAYASILASVFALAGDAARPDGLELERTVLEQHDLEGKLARYRRRAERYDLVFVGDSRTYCGMDPVRVDRELGTHSLNLASFGVWFETQYPFFQDLVPVLPPGTTVVWSVGHQNFHASDRTFNNTYPVGWRNVPRYLAWGYRWAAMAPNLKTYTPEWFRYVPGLGLYAESQRLHTELQAALDAPLRSASETSPARSEPGATARPRAAPGRMPPELRERWIRYFPFSPPRWPLAHLEAYLEVARAHDRPAVRRIEPVLHDDRIIAAELHGRRGGYVLVEIEPSYFRARQRAWAEELPPADDRFPLDKPRWRTFLASLDLFERHGVKLVVNEIEEAPYYYEDPARAAEYRGFMRDVVRPVVEARGIPYLRAPLERLDDAHYFDFNHLNDEGIERYIPMLAERLRPHLGR